MTTATLQPLVEIFSFDPNRLNESEGSFIKELAGGRYRVRTKGQHCGITNRNNRRYPAESTWGVHTRNEAAFQKRVRARRVVGQLEHPPDGKSAMGLGAIVITEVSSPDPKTGIVMVTFETMSTDAGKVCEAYIRDGVGFGLSSRGNGSVQRAHDGVDEVQPDFEPITFDCVCDESTPGAEVASRKLRENWNALVESVGEAQATEKAREQVREALQQVALDEAHEDEPPTGYNEFLLSLEDGAGHYRAYQNGTMQWDVWLHVHNLAPEKVACSMPTLKDAKQAAETHASKIVGEAYTHNGGMPFSGTMLELRFDSQGEARNALQALEKAEFFANLKGEDTVCVYTSYEDPEQASAHVQRILSGKKLEPRDESCGIIRRGRVIWEDDMSTMNTALLKEIRDQLAHLGEGGNGGQGKQDPEQERPATGKAPGKGRGGVNAPKATGTSSDTGKKRKTDGVKTGGGKAEARRRRRKPRVDERGGRRSRYEADDPYGYADEPGLDGDEAGYGEAEDDMPYEEPGAEERRRRREQDEEPGYEEEPEEGDYSEQDDDEMGYEEQDDDGEEEPGAEERYRRRERYESEPMPGPDLDDPEDLDLDMGGDSKFNDAFESRVGQDRLIEATLALLGSEYAKDVADGIRVVHERAAKWPAKARAHVQKVLEALIPKLEQAQEQKLLEAARRVREGLAERRATRSSGDSGDRSDRSSFLESEVARLEADNQRLADVVSAMQELHVAEMVQAKLDNLLLQHPILERVKGDLESAESVDALLANANSYLAMIDPRDMMGESRQAPAAPARVNGATPRHVGSFGTTGVASSQTGSLKGAPLDENNRPIGGGSKPVVSSTLKRAAEYRRRRQNKRDSSS